MLAWADQNVARVSRRVTPAALPVLFLLLCNAMTVISLASNETVAFFKCVRKQFHSDLAEVASIPRICFNSTHFYEVVDSPQESVNECLSANTGLCRGSYAPNVKGVRKQVTSSSIPASWTTSSGQAYLGADTIYGIQFGHNTAKFMQYHAVKFAAERCGFQGTLKYVSVHQTKEHMNRLPPMLDYIGRVALGGEIATMIDNGTMELRGPIKSAYHDEAGRCYENIIQVRANELSFCSYDHATLWHKQVEANLPHKVVLSKPLAFCPARRRALVLSRSEGVGLRLFLNFEVLEKVLFKYGFSDYTNLTISGHTPMHEVFEALTEYSLLVVKHSSQMKALIFARHGTAVVELRSFDDDAFVNQREPFGKGSGMKFANIVYHVAVQDPLNVNGTHSIRDDVYLDEQSVDNVIKAALDNQKLLCPHLA